MKTQAPYSQSGSPQDLLWTLSFTPLWWLLGFNIFIYQAVVILASVRLFVSAALHRKAIVVPNILGVLGLFLVSFFLSIAINLGGQPLQRSVASLNNYSMFVMGFFLVLVLYNKTSPEYFRDFFKASRTFCFVTGLIALAFLGLWFSPAKTFETQSLLGRLFPSLVEYPFFYLLLTIRGASPDWFIRNIPRLGIYSHAHIVTGGLMAMFIPLMMGYYRLKKKGNIEYAILLALSFVPLVFSLSRTAIGAFLGAFILTQVIDKNKKVYFVLVSLFLLVVAFNFVSQGVEWLLNLRGGSTLGRMDIYGEAVKIVWEHNPLMGVGVRPREGFTMMAIGSHSTYVGLLLVTGLIGLSLFVIFQLLVIVIWYAQKSHLRDEDSRIIWKYLGMSYLAATGSLLTSSVDAFPLMAYGYFFVVGCLLSFSRIARERVSVRTTKEAYGYSFR